MSSSSLRSVHAVSYAATPRVRMHAHREGPEAAEKAREAPVVDLLARADAEDVVDDWMGRAVRLRCVACGYVSTHAVQSGSPEPAHKLMR